MRPEQAHKYLFLIKLKPHKRIICFSKIVDKKTYQTINHLHNTKNQRKKILKTN